MKRTIGRDILDTAGIFAASAAIGHMMLDIHRCGDVRPMMAYARPACMGLAMGTVIGAGTAMLPQIRPMTSERAGQVSCTAAVSIVEFAVTRSPVRALATGALVYGCTELWLRIVHE